MLVIFKVNARANSIKKRCDLITGIKMMKFQKMKVQLKNDHAEQRNQEQYQKRYDIFHN